MSNLEASGHLVAHEVSPEKDLTVYVPALEKQILDTTLPLVQRFRALFTLKNIGGLAAITAIGKGK